MDITNGITEEIARTVRRNLICDGVAHLLMDEGKGARRIVLAAFHGTHEVMVAMEGSGCIIVDERTRINAFKFIAAGFQIDAARAMNNLFEALSGLDEPTQLQLAAPSQEL